MTDYIVQRDQRYKAPNEMHILARPYGMKFYNFMLQVRNLSASGILMASYTKAFVPFREGTVLNATLDYTGTLFERPIHLILEVKRVGNSEEIQLFGSKIVSVDRNHLKFYMQNLPKLPILDRKVDPYS